MHFVDDVDFVGAGGGNVADHLAQLADIVDAVVRGPVDLQHVHAGSVGDADAGRALLAGICSAAVGAVERLCENPGRGGFPYPARTAKQVAMCDPAGGEGVGQRRRDVLLADHLCKGLGPPFPGGDLVGHLGSGFCELKKGRAPIFEPGLRFGRCQLAPARRFRGTRNGVPTAATFRS